MNIKRNVEIPTNIGRSKLGETSLAVVEFLKSGDTNIKFECESSKEANTVYSTVSGTVKRLKLPAKVIKSMNDIYVVRKEDK